MAISRNERGPEFFKSPRSDSSCIVFPFLKKEKEKDREQKKDAKLPLSLRQPQGYASKGSEGGNVQFYQSLLQGPSLQDTV